MARIDFYEKPGCINNTKQKKILRNAGHEIIEHNLLTEPWTPGRLRPFFASKQVAEWFNRSAPRIKGGEIVPESIDADKALSLMIEDPLLIRRPLMATESLYLCGFDADEVSSMLGMAAEKIAGDLESCTQADSSRCLPQAKSA
jgi:nitrogenase-associated protein